MAEGCAFLCSKMLLSNVDCLYDKVEEISALKNLLELAFAAGKEIATRSMVSKIREQIVALHGVLNKIEFECQENIERTKLLKELEETAEKEQNEALYFLEVLPNLCSAWSSCELQETQKRDDRQLGEETKPTKASEIIPSKMLSVTAKDLEGVPAELQETQKCDDRQLGEETKPTKASEIIPSKMLSVTAKDLEGVPAYMKGRITCDQINAVIKNLNKAMMTKYKIRNQAPGSMNTTNKNLYYRYLREESEGTEGCCFIVEDDIKLFTSMKMDKRFHQIIIILRHCRRLREIRTSGIIRYAIC